MMVSPWKVQFLKLLTEAGFDAGIMEDVRENRSFRRALTEDEKHSYQLALRDPTVLDLLPKLPQTFKARK